MHIQVSDGNDVAFSYTENETSTISSRELLEMTNEEDGENDEESQQELSNVYTTTTIMENVRTEDLGIQYFKLTSGEFAKA